MRRMHAVFDTFSCDIPGIECFKVRHTSLGLMQNEHGYSNFRNELVEHTRKIMSIITHVICTLI